MQKNFSKGFDKATKAEQLALYNMAAAKATHPAPKQTAITPSGGLIDWSNIAPYPGWMKPNPPEKAKSPPKKTPYDYAKAYQKKKKHSFNPYISLSRRRYEEEQLNMIQTQKARGVLAAQNFAPEYEGLLQGPKGPILIFPDHMETQGGKMAELKWPQFARPCPKVPRHGFVESTPVFGWSEAMRRFRDTIAEDKNGEMILMPMLTGRYSAVATGNQVTWGRGNAGVTSGHDRKTVTIPTPFDKINWNSLWAERAKITDTAYFEIVENKGQTHLVQVRDGPEVPTSANFIPKAMIVKQVLDMSNLLLPDLLEWEKQINALKDPTHTAVILPDMPLSSHYAVHAVQAGAAVITDDSPVVIGDLLAPTKNAPPALKPGDFRKIAGAINHWNKLFLSMDLSDSRGKDFRFVQSLLSTTVGTIHAQHVWGNERYFLQLRGMAMSLLARFIVAGCVAEARYYWSTGPGRGGSNKKPAMDWEAITGNAQFRGDSSRESIYQLVLNADLDELQEMAEAAEEDFSDDWRPGSNVGGESWRASAEAALKLVKAIKAFLRYPTTNKWNLCIKAANVAVNAAHNNGRVLDKWLAGQHLDMIALNPVWGFLNPVAAQVVLGLNYRSRAIPFKRRRK